jgi:hypothetical protein
MVAQRVARDFKYLLSVGKSSSGEVELALRKGRLSLYYRGNSLATIFFRPRDLYRIEIHQEFVKGLGEETMARFEESCKYRWVEVGAGDAHRILQRSHIKKLMTAIREKNHSEELTFEQILITDNLPAPAFMLIDRQVRDRHLSRRLDLLGLRRLDDGRYGFVVLEVKMGNNKELSGAVADQLQRYVDHIRAPEHGDAWARCYQKNYAQKRRLGWIDDDRMPREIEIDGSQVEGLVVVGGYTQRAAAQLARLRADHPGLKVRAFANTLTDGDSMLVVDRPPAKTALAALPKEERAVVLAEQAAAAADFYAGEAVDSDDELVDY